MAVRTFRSILTVAIFCSTAFAQSAPAAATTPPGVLAGVRHVIGLENIKSQAGGKLSVQNGALNFTSGKTEVKVPVSSIEDIFVGSETTQGGGKVGRVVKTAAIAAPYESGKVLTLLMRTKVDILTVSYRDPNGALHAAILALPKDQGEGVRAKLIAAGAHTGPASERELKARTQ
jgi:hypothetical protein